MREIKFRGKRLDNEEWIAGTYHYIIKKEFYSIMAHELFDHEQNRLVSAPESGAHKVDPNTVGEFTGLRDRNGRDIYEGDIIRSFNDDVETDSLTRIKIVVWNEAEAMFEFDSIGGGRYLCAANSKHISVIGNIHDNPELVPHR